MKKCQYCAEDIQDAAVVCRFCNRTLTDAPAATTATAPGASTKAKSPKWAVAAIVVGALTSFAGNAALGLGIIAMWVGFAQVITGSAMKRYGGGFIGALLVGSIIAGVSGQTSTPTTSSTGAGRQSTASNTSAPPPRQQEPPLALVAARGYESDSGGYWYVEGQVRNISNESLSRVTAVSTWFTKDDQFITTHQALIDFDPILAGQTSPFKTITRGNPAMSKYKVEFKELLGGSIAVRDDRKQ